MEQVAQSRDTKKHSGTGHQRQGSFFGGNGPDSFFGPAIQPKLTVGAANDSCEQEADAVAAQVMQMEAPAAAIAPAAPLVRRSGEDGEGDGDEQALPEMDANTIMDVSADGSDATPDESTSGETTSNVNTPDVSVPDVTQKPEEAAPVQTKCAQCEEEEKKSGVIQRKCAHCEEEEKGTVQRKCAQCDHEEQQQGLVQRQVTSHESINHHTAQPCAQCESQSIQRKETGASSGAGASVESALQSTGQSMDGGTQQFMESRFGQDFSQVQIHNDTKAHQSADSINAHAYTHQQHVVFAEGQYQPGTDSGKQLLAHELTHVVQQGKGVSRKLVQRDPGKKKQSEYLEFQVFVPADYATSAQMFRLLERTAYHHEVGHEWTCGGGPCDVTKFRGKTIKFLALRSNVEARTTADDKKKSSDSKTAYDGLSKADKDKVDKEADKRYHEESKTDKNEKIKKGEEGKALQWTRNMEDVMAEKKALAELPEDLKAILGTGNGVDPKDHAQLMRILAKLKTFTPEDIAVYKLLTLKATDNLDLFEKSVDMFLARKEVLKEAMAKQQQAPPAADADKDKGPASMEEAMKGAWTDVDPKAYATMTEDERLALALRKRDEVTKAQLKYMKDHPGETATDFVKSATLMNSGETFEGVAKDLKEAANGDANSWARFAGGAGAGAKLSGWLLAAGALLYAASWLTGIGELATIAAGMAYLLGANIVLSAAESDLRVKAASQAKTLDEHEEQVNKGAAAQTSVLMALGTLALSMAFHFVAKTYFPATMKAVGESLARFREKVRIVGGIEPAKVELSTEMDGHKTKLTESAAEAKQQASAKADAIEKMSTDEFVEKLEAGTEDYAQAPTQKGQKMPWKDFAQTPEGRKAIEMYKQGLVNELRTDAPAAIDQMLKDQVDAIDSMVKKAQAATTPNEFADALGDFEKFNSPEASQKRAAERDLELRQKKIDEGLKDLEKPNKAPEIEKSGKSIDGKREVKLTKEKQCIVCASPCDEIKAKFKDQIAAIKNSGGKDYNVLLEAVEKGTYATEEERYAAYKKLEQEIADSKLPPKPLPKDPQVEGEQPKVTPDTKDAPATGTKEPAATPGEKATPAADIDVTKLVDADLAGLTKGAPLPDGLKIFRIGGKEMANLYLKKPEMKLTPPGFSTMRAGSAAEALAIMKAKFPDPVKFSKLWDQFKVMPAEITTEDIRKAGFDIIHDPTEGVGPRHARVVHPAGNSGFVAESLAKLAALFK